MSFYSYGRQRFMVKRDDLTAFAWSAPMRDLAKKADMTDVGLKKLLKSFGIPTPPQGHWNRVHARRPVQAPPKAPPRRAGQTGRLFVDDRFRGLVPEALPIRSDMPFATRSIPENLDDLRAQELKALGKVGVPSLGTRSHPEVAKIIAKEERRRAKTAEKGFWNFDKPRFDTPLAQRQMRILNAVLLALAKRGHNGSAYEQDYEIHSRAMVGDTPLGLSLEIVGKFPTELVSGYRRPSSKLQAKTPLMFRLIPDFAHERGESWKDDDEGTLESKIAAIAAGIIVAGEAKFRKDLKDAEERAERERIAREEAEERAIIERERRRLEGLRAANERRLADLKRSGELLRLSRDIRELVREVRSAMLDSQDVDMTTVTSWERWALSEADRLDPILSKQFHSHLLPPEAIEDSPP